MNNQNNVTEELFIEDFGSSDGEDDSRVSFQRSDKLSKQVSRLSRERSPPLLLTFTSKSGRTPQDRDQSPVCSDDPQEDWDQSPVCSDDPRDSDQSPVCSDDPQEDWDQSPVCSDDPQEDWDQSPVCSDDPRDSDQSPVCSDDPQEDWDQSPVCSDDPQDRDQPIEEWMIIGSEDQVGDSSIHVHLSYWNSSEDSGDEGQKIKSEFDAFTVSEKDKSGAEKSQTIRYWEPSNTQTCNICNRMGHLARSCYYNKKCPICVLCGIQGHIQRDCPGRPCQSCGLPPHYSRPCERPPVWNQHCQRCGMAGHLSDVCPDTWRQYHLTIRLEVPLRPSTVHTLKRRNCLTFCYNCSKRGHHGYECSKRRMVSGTFPSLPYVCHYDSVDDILKHRTKIHVKGEDISAGSRPLSDQQTELIRESGEENQLLQGRFRTKQEACIQAGRRKTWPERRRERREVKRLRREAQARREGGLLGRSWGKFDDEVCPSDPFTSPFFVHKQSKSLPLKRKRDEVGGRRSRKSREAERWKKRGGLKRGDLYPHGDVDINSENLLSPKHRVRHRRR